MSPNSASSGLQKPVAFALPPCTCGITPVDSLALGCAMPAARLDAGCEAMAHCFRCIVSRNYAWLSRQPLGCLCEASAYLRHGGKIEQSLAVFVLFSPRHTGPGRSQPRTTGTDSAPARASTTRRTSLITRSILQLQLKADLAVHRAIAVSELALQSPAHHL
jgi:hypothetical protein